MKLTLLRNIELILLMDSFRYAGAAPSYPKFGKMPWRELISSPLRVNPKSYVAINGEVGHGVASCFMKKLRLM